MYLLFVKTWSWTYVYNSVSFYCHSVRGYFKLHTTSQEEQNSFLIASLYITNITTGNSSALVFVSAAVRSFFCYGAFFLRCFFLFFTFILFSLLHFILLFLLAALNPPPPVFFSFFFLVSVPPFGSWNLLSRDSPWGRKLCSRCISSCQLQRLAARVLSLQRWWTRSCTDWSGRALPAWNRRSRRAKEESEKFWCE